MSARRGRSSRRGPVSSTSTEEFDLWWRAVGLRAEWLEHSLSSAPADRAATEDAIAGLYGLVNQPPPDFVWVDSPAAAVRLLPSAPPATAPDGAWPLENRLATLVCALRERLDRRLGVHRSSHGLAAPSPVPDAVAALRTGVTLSSVLDANVRGALRRGVRDTVAGLVRSATSERLGLLWYGQHDADWVAYYDLQYRIRGARFAPADLAQLELWAALARSCGWWWPRADVCVVAERPAELHTETVPGSINGEVRLHNASGPAVSFPDGWAVHSWHGTRVPSWVIEAPAVELIAEERNIEVRRCAIERLGWETFIEQARLVLVGQAADPGNPGSELRLYDLPYQPWGTSTRLLLAVNGSVERDGTRRRYGLRVPPWFTDPIDAAGWSYGLTGAQYGQLLRRT